MARTKGINKISLNKSTLCEIVQDWLNSGGPFTKNPVTVTDAEARGYDGMFDFTFGPGSEDKKPEAEVAT